MSFLQGPWVWQKDNIILGFFTWKSKTLTNLLHFIWTWPSRSSSTSNSILTLPKISAFNILEAAFLPAPRQSVGEPQHITVFHEIISFPQRSILRGFDSPQRSMLREEYSGPNLRQYLGTLPSKQTPKRVVSTSPKDSFVTLFVSAPSVHRYHDVVKITCIDWLVRRHLRASNWLT